MRKHDSVVRGVTSRLTLHARKGAQTDDIPVDVLHVADFLRPALILRLRHRRCSLLYGVLHSHKILPAMRHEMVQISVQMKSACDRQ
jgi:hypothetical protein